MSKSAEKLTTKKANTAEARKDRYCIWDSVVPGFGMVVRPSGAKSFIFQYRNLRGERPRIKIGDLGPLTVEQARDIARKYYAEVAQKKDPRDLLKPAPIGGMTINDLLDRYLKSAKFAALAKSTRDCDPATFNNHVRPLIGPLVISDMTPDDLQRMVLDVTKGKTTRIRKTGPRGKSMVKGGAGAAQTCLRKIKAVLSWGVSESLITNHPGIYLKAGKNGRREDYMENPDYASVFKTMELMGEEGSLRPTVADAIRLIALTGARRNEICALVWRQVDLDNGTITLTRGEHKGGHKTGAAKTIVLPPAAREIIERQPRRGQNDRVFKAARGNGSATISVNHPWQEIRRRAGVSDKIVIHSLRHSLASHMANNHQDALAIKAVLGHKDISTSMIYIHLSKETHRRHAETAASGIANLIGGDTE